MREVLLPRAKAASLQAISDLLTIRRGTWCGNRPSNNLLQISPMKGIANDCTGYQEEANQKNGADIVCKPIAMLRAVFF